MQLNYFAVPGIKRMDTNKPVNAKTIEAGVSQYYNVPLHKIFGKSRKTEFKRPRHVIWYLENKYSGMNYVQISRMYHKNHSTIMNAVKKVASFYKNEDSTQKEIDDLLLIIGK